MRTMLISNIWGCLYNFPKVCLPEIQRDKMRDKSKDLSESGCNNTVGFSGHYMTHHHLKKSVKCGLTQSGKLKPEYRPVVCLGLEENMATGLA